MDLWPTQGHAEVHTLAHMCTHQVTSVCMFAVFDNLMALKGSVNEIARAVGVSCADRIP